VLKRLESTLIVRVPPFVVTSGSSKFEAHLWIQAKPRLRAAPSKHADASKRIVCTEEPLIFAVRDAQEKERVIFALNNVIAEMQVGVCLFVFMWM